ncbi:MAG: DUF3108 domain-containing protein [Alphaproteobacteria bacterium]|nr:DUF3108 domain-containing protein [Alphaproteobacteria bacterium]
MNRRAGILYRNVPCVLRAGLAILGMVGALCALDISAAQAGELENRQKLVYEVYAGGIHAVQAHLEMDLTRKGRYDLTLAAKTRGFLASLVPWEGTFESRGWVVGGEDGFRPEQHKSTAYWRDEIDIKDYRYKKDGHFISLTSIDEKGKSEERDLSPEVTDGTVDTLSATLQVLAAFNKTGKCEGESDVFDGKRRFRQIFRHTGEAQMEPTKYNIFKGKAAECTVEVVPVTGEWSKKPRGWLSIQEQGRERGMMPTLWIAQLHENGPAVPVKIRVKTAYGTLFMHLAEYQSGDQLVVAQKRVKD